MRVTGPIGPTLMNISSTDSGVILRKHYEGSQQWLEIISALPEALFSGELLHEVRTGGGFPDITLDRLGTGGVLRIKGRDRVVVYVLTGHDEQLGIYFGRWPD